MRISLNIAAPGVLQNDGDAESDPLKALLASGPSHGSLLLKSSGGFTYAAAAGYVGADSFTYYATDGFTNSATVTVSLDVRAPLALVQNTPRFNENRASASADIVLRFNRACLLAGIRLFCVATAVALAAPVWAFYAGNIGVSGKQGHTCTA